MRRRGRRSVAAPQEENRCGEVSEMEERFFVPLTAMAAGKAAVDGMVE